MDKVDKTKEMLVLKQKILYIRSRVKLVETTSDLLTSIVVIRVRRYRTGAGFGVTTRNISKLSNLENKLNLISFLHSINTLAIHNCTVLVVGLNRDYGSDTKT